MPNLSVPADIDDVLIVLEVLQVISDFMGGHAERLLSQEQVDRADIAATSLIRVLTEIMPYGAPELAKGPHEETRQ